MNRFAYETEKGNYYHRQMKIRNIKRKLYRLADIVCWAVLITAFVAWIGTFLYFKLFR